MYRPVLEIIYFNHFDTNKFSLMKFCIITKKISQTQLYLFNASNKHGLHKPFHAFRKFVESIYLTIYYEQSQ